MNKLIISIIILIMASCSNSKNENQNNYSEYTKSEKGCILSKIIPHYLPDKEDYFKISELNYLEHLDPNGLPLRLEVSRNEKIEYMYDFKYNANKQLIKQTIIRNQYKDTIEEIITWKENVGTTNTSKGFRLPEVLISNGSGLIEERYQSENLSPGYYLLSKFDELGRPISSIRLINSGVDTDVYYEKYRYSNNEVLWTERETYTYKNQYSSEDIDSGTINIKNEVLKFPDNFKEVSKKIIEKRIIEF